MTFRYQESEIYARLLLVWDLGVIESKLCMGEKKSQHLVRSGTSYVIASHFC